jgi:tetratricopeptide (TPR) repeat protein
MPKDEETTRYHRVALAQVSFNPAYVDSSGTSDIHEPVFPDSNQFHGLHKVADIPEVADLRLRIAQSYLRHVSDKIKCIAEFASAHGAEVLLLPEYSVPPEMLGTCKDLACRLQLVIIAGSHTVTQTALEQYRRIGISNQLAGKTPGLAICPVFVPGEGCILFEKITRSKWESDMIPGTSIPPVTLKLKGESVRLQVLICIDALQDPPVGSQRKFRDSIPTLVAIPVLSPDMKLFHHKAELVLASGRCVILANAAEHGGSRVYARAERCARWLAAQNGTEPMPKGAEALVVIDVDLGHQYEVRQSTNESFPVADIQVYPLVYAEHSPATRRYLEFRKLVQSREPPAGEDTRRMARDLALANSREFPALMQEKLRHFLDHVDGAGLADSSAWRNWTDAVIVSSEPTAALRARLCSSAINTITQAVLARNPSKVPLLTEEYTYLAKRYTEIAASLPAFAPPAQASPEAAPSPEPPPSFEPPFYDRDTLLDAIRKSIEAAAKPCQVIAGMRGIGKTSIVRELVKKIILPTWKRVWVQVTEGMSLPRLLGEIAYRLELRIPADLPGDAVSSEDLAQNVLLCVSQTNRIAIVLDDFQYLLGPDREPSDPATGDFLRRLIRSAATRKNVLLITTTHVPAWREEVGQLIDTHHVGGLDDKTSERLFSFWFRFEREDLSGHSLTYPDRALGLVRGHPLAVKLAAKMWAEQPRADMVLFKRLREAMVEYVLGQVTLAPHEEEFLRFASIFRVPVRREAFVRWKSDEAVGLLESLLGQSLLENEGDVYQLHPLVRDHYYLIADFNILRPLHQIAGLYFLDLYKEARTTGSSVDPEVVAEAVHHLLCAGERGMVKELGLYRYELRPVALNHYRKRNYDVAVREYRLLVDLDANDHDAHFHLALIYANDEKWDDAETHFGKAMQIKPGAFWILQGYAHVLLRKNHQLLQAEQLLQRAERLNPYHSFTLVDLGRLSARTERDAEAEEYFRRAIAADPDNTRAYYEYARFLRDLDRLEEALDMAIAAVESNPADTQNKALVRELRQRLDDAQNQS